MKLSAPQRANRKLHLTAVIEVERAAIAKELSFVLRGMNRYNVGIVGQPWRSALDFMKEKHDANVAELEALNKEN